MVRAGFVSGRRALIVASCPPQRICLCTNSMIMSMARLDAGEPALRMMKPCPSPSNSSRSTRSEEHTSELQSLAYLVCRLLLEKKKRKKHLPEENAETCYNL